MTRLTPVGAVMRGLLAGVAGTAVMTAVQTAYYKATGNESSSTPGEVGRRIVAGVLQREAPEADWPPMNQGMHWLYGSSWGVPYGIFAGSGEPGSLLKGVVACTLMVWGASLVQLPAMRLAPPVWEMPPSSIAMDLGFHAAYGVGTAVAFRAIRG